LRPPQDQSKTINIAGADYSSYNLVTTYTNTTASGNILTSYSYKPKDDSEESIYNTNQQSELKTTVIDA
jgi:hypothetical protein